MNAIHRNPWPLLLAVASVAIMAAVALPAVSAGDCPGGVCHAPAVGGPIYAGPVYVAPAPVHVAPMPPLIHPPPICHGPTCYPVPHCGGVMIQPRPFRYRRSFGISFHFDRQLSVPHHQQPRHCGQNPRQQI